MTQYGFCINLDLCAGCKACALACKDKNDLAIGTKYRKVIDCASGEWTLVEGAWICENVFSYSVSLACNHCAAPACVAECPTGAMTKDPDTGIVTSNSEVCIGCGTCVEACPYNEPRLVEDKTAHSGKCDLCKDLIAEDESPRCVSACIMRALTFGDIDELRETYGTNADVQPLPSSDATKPSLIVISSRWNAEDALKSQIISTQEETA